MKQPYVCVCFPACVINVSQCVCFGLSIQSGGKKIQLGVSTADRHNRKDVTQAFQLSSLIYSRPWSFLQHIHPSHCLCCQLPSVAQNKRRVLLLAVSSTEPGPPATLFTDLNQPDWKVAELKTWSWDCCAFLGFCSIYSTLESCFLWKGSRRPALWRRETSVFITTCVFFYRMKVAIITFCLVGAIFANPVSI